MNKTSRWAAAWIGALSLLAAAGSGFGQATPAPGELQIILQPRAAVTAGAGWRLPGETAYHPSVTPVQMPPGSYLLEFKPLDQYSPPPRQILVVRSGRRTPVAASYGRALGKLPLASPDLHLSTDGSIYALARQENGDLLVGGSFTSINGAPRKNLARVHADGTVDLSWEPEPDDAVGCLVISGSRVYVAGIFWRIGAGVRPALALVELTGSGAVVPGFNAQVYPVVTNAAIGYPDRASVGALFLSPRGLFVHGDFTAIGGVGGFRFNSQPVAKLNPATGRADATWTARYRGYQREATDALSGAGDLLFVQRDSKLERISPVTGLIYPGWQTSLVSGQSMRPGSDALYLLTNQQLKRYPTALNGAADPNWAPDFGGATVLDIRELSGGYLYVSAATPGAHSGDFTDYRLLRVQESTGQVDGSWHTGSSEGLLLHDLTAYPPVLVTPEGVLAGSESEDSSGGFVDEVRRFSATTGARDSSLQTRTAANEANLSAFAVTPTGQVLLSNPPIEFGTKPTLGLVRAADQPLSTVPRFNADGTLDTAWNPQIDGPVTDLLTDGGYVYICGTFSHVGSVARPGLARLALSGSGEADTSWDPVGATDPTLVSAGLLLISNGYLFFQAGHLYHSDTILRRASLAAGSAIDAGWSSGLQQFAHVNIGAALAEGGWLYLSGYFIRNVSGAPSQNNSFVRIDAVNGGVDPQWHPPVVRADYGSPLATDGQYLYFGSQVGRTTAGQIGRLLLTTGAADPSWRSVADGTVLTLAIGDGTLYAGGYFSAIGGQTGSNVARLPLANGGHADRTFIYPLVGKRNLLKNFSAVNRVLPVGHTLFVSGVFNSISGQAEVDFAALPLP